VGFTGCRIQDFEARKLKLKVELWDVVGNCDGESGRGMQGLWGLLTWSLCIAELPGPLDF